MRSQHLSAIGVVSALLLVLGMGRMSSAALMEKPVLDGINNTIAVLRYLHRQVADAQGNLDLVHAAKDLTQRQLEAQKKLYDTEVAQGHKERAEFFSNRMKRLQRQMTRLNEFDFDKSYGIRITDVKGQIAKITEELDARMTEYEVLFGKKPKVEVAFEEEMKRYKPKRPEAAFFLDLD